MLHSRSKLEWNLEGVGKALSVFANERNQGKNEA
jgi:hypothetical protein